MRTCAGGGSDVAEHPTATIKASIMVSATATYMMPLQLHALRTSTDCMADAARQ